MIVVEKTCEIRVVRKDTRCTSESELPFFIQQAVLHHDRENGFTEKKWVNVEEVWDNEGLR